jgi:hypothetical protein
MKSIVLFAILAATSTVALADTYVRGYTRSDGTYVQGHTRSSPDSIRSNNYGSQTNGVYQRDENSSNSGATNKSNSSYGWRDNDNDGVSNAYDPSPEKKGW